MDNLIMLTEDEMEAVSGGSLTLSCCSFDIGFMTVNWDAFKIQIGGAFSADYGTQLSSAYNRL